MKYLKLFESYVGYYSEIDDVSYSEYIGFNIDTGIFNDDFDRYYEDFTSDEIHNLKILFSMYEIEFYHPQNRKEIKSILNIVVNYNPSLLSPNKGGNFYSVYTFSPKFTITKLRDSWYIVYDCDNTLFYKCDEYEGLKKYIIDRTSNKIKSKL